MIHADGAALTNEQFFGLLYGEATGTRERLLYFTGLREYAREHNYLLAAAFGSSVCNLHLYFVRRDFPDSAAITAIIRDHPYYFLDNDVLSHDFRNELPPKGASDFSCRLPQ